MTETPHDFDALAARLTERARTLAEAKARDTRLGKAQPAARWRSAHLLWPLFTKG
ncbi:MAG TPA: hypothetical protein PKG84_03875 [Novosphingobium sp.]|nr:hypothetical protein [Novosphingobium sp.]